MPLNKTKLKSDIVSALTDMMEREETSIDELATRLTNAVDDYTKSATVVYQNGLVAPSGAVTGVFNGKLE